MTFVNYLSESITVYAWPMHIASELDEEAKLIQIHAYWFMQIGSDRVLTLRVD
jgi:hypothetical protein